jgi:hypothetical protein
VANLSISGHHQFQNGETFVMMDFPMLPLALNKSGLGGFQMLSILHEKNKSGYNPNRPEEKKKNGLRRLFRRNDSSKEGPMGCRQKTLLLQVVI